MLSESEIEDIIKNKIDQDEGLGDQVGGSGHLGYVSYTIDNISQPKRVETDKGDGWEITYDYTLIVETEFTYYPDNPPREYKYKKTIILDNNGKIISESPKEATNSPFSPPVL